MWHLLSLLISGKDKRCILFFLIHPLKKPPQIPTTKTNSHLWAFRLAKRHPSTVSEPNYKKLFHYLYVLYGGLPNSLGFLPHRMNNSVLFAWDHKSRKKHIDHLVFFDFFFFFWADYTTTHHLHATAWFVSFFSSKTIYKYTRPWTFIFNIHGTHRTTLVTISKEDLLKE